MQYVYGRESGEQSGKEMSERRIPVNPQIDVVIDAVRAFPHVQPLRHHPRHLIMMRSIFSTIRKAGRVKKRLDTHEKADGYDNEKANQLNLRINAGFSAALRRPRPTHNSPTRQNHHARKNRI
ncbi:MAG: hypothetical protein V1875_08800 [Candidatus Altiarchaeota archaeon]